MNGAPGALLRARLQSCHLVHVWPPASAAEVKFRRGAGGGVGIEFWCGSEAGADGIVVEIGAADFQVIFVADAVVGEAALPDGGF